MKPDPTFLGCCLLSRGEHQASRTTSNSLGMFIFKHGCRSAITRPLRQSINPTWIRSASRISISTPPPFPVVETCPNPTCQCQETPPDLDIDHEAPLNGTTAAYAEQVLISTGRSDWKSRIEDDDDGVLVKQLKKFLGRGGKYSDVSTSATCQSKADIDNFNSPSTM